VPRGTSKHRGRHAHVVARKSGAHLVTEAHPVKETTGMKEPPAARWATGGSNAMVTLSGSLPGRSFDCGQGIHLAVPIEGVITSAAGAHLGRATVDRWEEGVLRGVGTGHRVCR